MSLSFPYPVLGATRRPVGQGCKVCVHRVYCPAMYWSRRYGQALSIEDGWSGPDDHMGIQCASWSDNPADKLPGIANADDLAEEAYMYNQGIGSEADRNGITTPTTGTGRRP